MAFKRTEVGEGLINKGAAVWKIDRRHAAWNSVYDLSS